jgi:hypothetical protein
VHTVHDEAPTAPTMQRQCLQHHIWDNPVGVRADFRGGATDASNPPARLSRCITPTPFHRKRDSSGICSTDSCTAAAPRPADDMPRPDLVRTHYDSAQSAVTGLEPIMSPEGMKLGQTHCLIRRSRLKVRRRGPPQAPGTNPLPDSTVVTCSRATLLPSQTQALILRAHCDDAV